MALQSEIQRVEPNLEENIQHASCSRVYPIGTYPGKALCGVEFAGPCSVDAKKCNVCLDLIGKFPCPICKGSALVHRW